MGTIHNINVVYNVDATLLQGGFCPTDENDFEKSAIN
jgi:hypothetical protein